MDNNTKKKEGRPSVDPYKRQNKRVQFFISQEAEDILSPIATLNGCKDVTAYAKKLLLLEIEKQKLG